jgi:hypothetical protein
LVLSTTASYIASIFLSYHKKLPHRIDHGINPAEGILFYFVIESLGKEVESCIPTGDDNVLKKVVFNVLREVFQGFKYSSCYALLLQAYVLRVEEYLRDLKSLLVQRYMLIVDAYRNSESYFS